MQSCEEMRGQFRNVCLSSHDDVTAAQVLKQSCCLTTPRTSRQHQHAPQFTFYMTPKGVTLASISSFSCASAGALIHVCAHVCVRVHTCVIFQLPSAVRGRSIRSERRDSAESVLCTRTHFPSHTQTRQRRHGRVCVQ